MGIWEWLKGNPEKKYRERFPEREKTSEPAAEDTEEPTSAPAAEEADKQTSEPLAEESSEPTAEPAAEKPEDVPSETPVEEIGKEVPEDLAEGMEEPPPEPAAEEPEKLASELPAEKAEAEETPSEPLPEETEEPILEPLPEEKGEPVPAPLAEEPIEVPPEPPTRETEKPRSKRRKLGFGGFGGSLKKQKPGSKKKEKESTPDPEFFKLLIFPLTLASMLLGLSIMPLFPQPLPTILAFLIAFVTYKKPRIGMPIGGLTVGLGLMYNLSEMDFISMLGATELRGAFVFGLLFLFTVLPVIFHSRRAVISINLGIIAAIMLFFSQTYFLAIPLIFTAVVFFKKISFLTAVYYVLISVPFQIMQYLNLVMPIERWDWWIEPGTSPPIYVPLTDIFTNVQESMLQFRLYDTSKVVYAISDQITLDPPVLPHTVQEMISHYFDSLPGIVLFLFMVIGIVTAFVFFARTFFSKSSISYAERLLPTMSATIGVALFFILATSLQGALAFRVDVNGAQMAIATFATLLFTLPTLLIDYTPKRRATVDMIMEKAKDLKAKLLLFEEELDEVKSNLPISTGAFEVKTMMVRDRLNEVLSKASMRLEDNSEIDKIFTEIDSLSCEIDNLTAELYVSVGEYQIFVNCEYSKWLGMFKDLGLETEVSAEAVFQPEAPLGTRIEQIKEVTMKGQAYATEIIDVAEQGYDVIRSFFDPTLSEENQSIVFARKKLGEKPTPWIALDALFTALNNWNKQYKARISKSIGHLKDSLTAIANLSAKSEKLQAVLGETFPRMSANIEKAEALKLDLENRTLNVINGKAIKDVFQSSLSVVGDTLSVLDEKLKSEEKAIENLAPTQEFFWEKNDALRNQLSSAIEITSNPSKAKLSEVLESLTKFLSHIDECLKTIAVYNYTEELLLNYPIAEKAVERLLSEKKHISVEDLPFEPKFAEEYLKLFYSQRFREFSLDKANMLRTKKT